MNASPMTADEYRQQMGLDLAAADETMTLAEYRRLIGLGDPDGPQTLTQAEYAALLKEQQERPEAEELLLQAIRLARLPEPVREYKFHPRRRWRLDFAWPERKVAFEVDGGIWQQTDGGFSKGHAHPLRFISDIEKRNAANIAGWCLLHATPQQVKDGTAVRWLKKALKA